MFIGGRKASVAIEQGERFCFQCGFVATGNEATCPTDGSLLRSGPKDPFLGTTLLGKYEVMHELGSGGMSVVYKVRHVLLGRIEALKMLRRELVYDSDAFRRFQQESRAVSALRHVNVVRVLDFGALENESPYLTMEFLDGKDLAAILKAEHRLTVDRAIPLFLQICEGLFHAHSSGVVHRDIKPSNIIITSDSNGKELAVIVDFGIAKLVGPDGSSISKLTRTGEIFGSPLFMSPEQCSGKKLDEKTDIYAVGCMLYQALTGVVPFRGATPMETMMRHMQDSPPPFFTVTSEVTVPTALESSILKCLAKNPDDRFANMNQLRKALLKSVGLPVTDLEVSGRNKRVATDIDDTKSGAYGGSDLTQLSTDSRLRLEQDELKDSLAAAVENEPLVGKSVKKLAILSSLLVVVVGVAAYLFFPLVLQQQKRDDTPEQPSKPLTTRDDVFSKRTVERQAGSTLPHCYLSGLKTFTDWRCCTDQADSLSSEMPPSGTELGVVYIIAYGRTKGQDLKALAQSECEQLAQSGIKTGGAAQLVLLGNDVKAEAILQILDYGPNLKGVVIFYSDNGQPGALQIVPRRGSKLDLNNFVETRVIPAFTTRSAQ